MGNHATQHLLAGLTGLGMLAGGRVLQRFADKHNDQRRQKADKAAIENARQEANKLAKDSEKQLALEDLEAKIKLAREKSSTAPVFIQLDHSVSQDTLKKLADDLGKIKLISAPKNAVYLKTKKEYENFARQVASMDEASAHNPEDDLAGLLLNLRANLTPGYKETTGNPGMGFDPQVEHDESETTGKAVNGPLLELDNNARRLGRLHFPNQHEGMQSKLYKEGLDTEIAASVGAITRSLAVLKNAAEPEFDPSIWYRFETKMVKRVRAQWQAAKPKDLGKSKYDYPDLAETTFNWTVSPSKTTGGNDPTVAIKVIIPVSCWEHIYDRHTISHFAGDVKPIDTFWKDDPQDVITENLLRPEIELLLDRRFHLRRLLEEESGESESIKINEPVDRLFFQGSVDAKTVVQNVVATKPILQDSDEPEPKYAKVGKRSRNQTSRAKPTPTKSTRTEPTPTKTIVAVVVSLESIAPQHESLAIAVEPGLL